MRYVVIAEIPDTGFMDCVGIYDNVEQAYGKAYLSLGDGLDEGEYYLTLPEEREGESGYIMECRSKTQDRTITTATVLFFKEDDDEE